MNIRRCGAFLLSLFLPTVVAYSQHVSFGFVGGTPLTRDFPISRVFFTNPEMSDGLIAFDWFSDTRSFLAGLSVEIDLGKGVSVEGNALHRNLHLQMRYVFPNGTSRFYQETTPSTWEWPILAKYRLPLRGAARPFIEAGPSFRTRHNPVPSEPSQFGGTVGTGVEFRLGRFRVSPALRYTRWQYDGDYPRAATKRDQIEFVTGISYATSVPSWRLGNRKLRLGLVGGTPLTGGLAACVKIGPFSARSQQKVWGRVENDDAIETDPLGYHSLSIDTQSSGDPPEPRIC